MMKFPSKKRFWWWLSMALVPCVWASFLLGYPRIGRALFMFSAFCFPADILGIGYGRTWIDKLSGRVRIDSAPFALKPRLYLKVDTFRGDGLWCHCMVFWLGLQLTIRAEYC